MAEAVTTRTRLAIVREIQEDSSGATLRFQQGGQGRIALGDANYEAHLRLARRSQERQHPVGIRFGEGQTIAELIRADNDVPTKVCEDAAGARVFFQGHDGIFRLQADHTESARLRPAWRGDPTEGSALVRCSEARSDAAGHSAGRRVSHFRQLR